ncbi:acetolactate synthase small subunit [Salinisphaera sp. Q1T1-3]|uniref:acetolactate synthase small subunit n=1 Tax=Salinisphaera sp. Q1T1-3 TaxID=2321229 RepID=UPI000E74764E|nr:acetolactate synthase small subunit [Salinisphaera sp. Q1T1-3]RJS93843.1 acetolactate synthase small subunit [Salinisphaera sp. Q1T1-3]
MRHVISILMANEAGALVRVAGLFSQRGFNIETLNVGPTEDPTMSRLTLVTEGTENVIEQINRQLLKLVDVIDVLDMTGDEHLESELALIKVRRDTADQSLEALSRGYETTLISEEDGLALLRFLGSGDELNRFIGALESAGLLVELARSGAVTMTPGASVLRYRRADVLAVAGQG